MSAGTAIRYLEPNEVRIWQPEDSSHLRVEISGDRVILDARVRCVFPLSHPSEYISIQDGAGKEVGVLRTTQGMPSADKELLDGALDRLYFTPIIRKIDALKLDAGMWRFEVQTQRGNTEFYVRNWRDSAAEIEPGRWQVWSVDGQRFEIPKPEFLDARSLALLEQLL